MWSGYLFDVCIRKIHLCAFLIYMAGRQTGWKTTNHGNQPWLQPNDRLQLQSKTKTVICISGHFLSVQITVESDVMQGLNPQFIHHEPYRKRENNNPVASQSAPWTASCFLTVWSKVLLSHLFTYFIKRHFYPESRLQKGTLPKKTVETSGSHCSWTRNRPAHNHFYTLNRLNKHTVRYNVLISAL